MTNHLTAGGIVFHQKNDEKRYLILFRKKNEEEEWTFPKGHLDPDESAQEAAAREIQEESGLKVGKSIAFLATTQYQYQDATDHSMHDKKVDWFLFKSNVTEIFCQQEEGFIDYKWASYEEAYALLKHENMRHLISIAQGFFQN